MLQVTLEAIRTMAEAAAGEISHIYLHWSAGHYGQFFNDYHIMIDQDGTIVASTDDLTTVLAHTWNRNTGAIGIALACCVDGTTNDLGPEPPTDAQIESMAQVIAVLCTGLGIACNKLTVMTHAEAADLDEYGPATTCERWDLAILHNGDEWMSGGDVLRGKAIWYQQNGVGA